MKKKVLITGACGGIGSALVAQFCEENYHIIALDLKAEDLEKLEKEHAGNLSAYAFDLSRSEKIQALCERILLEHGEIDILINNAGIANLHNFHEEGLENFSKAMKINFEAAVRLTYFWLPLLEKRNGKIINIASLAGHVAPAGMSSYTCSKFALVGFSRSLQGELAARKSKTKVILVSPGFVLTPIMKMGEKGGFPDSLKFLATTPKSCAQEIVQAIKKNKDFITPGISGKAIALLNTWAPGILSAINVKLSQKVFN